MAIGFLIKFMGTIMDLFIPWILAYLIDDIVPTQNTNLIIFWGVMMMICSGAALAGNVIANRMASRVARDTARRIRFELFSKISYLSNKQMDAFTIPSLESRLTSDTYNIHQMLGMMQRLGVRAPILLIGGLLITSMMEPVLTLVLVALLPFITIVVFRISRKGIPMFTQTQKAVDGMVRVVRENIQGIRVIKALSREEREEERFKAENSNVVDHEKRASFLMAKTNPLMNLFLNAGLVFVILLGAYRVNLGVSEPGKIIAFMSYVTLILNAMLSITRMFTNLSRGTASANRIGEVIDAPVDMEVVPARESSRSDAHIEFKNVSFSYNGVKNNITDISFSLKKGQTLGIIGATGSGKSTIISLLMRFYDIDSGEILIDGRNIKSMPPEILRTKFGVVFQNDFLYADTIEANIDFGRDLAHDRIEHATEMAQAAPFITDIEAGFEHELTIKGSNLSGGQKQRVLISRALAADPEVLVLDDSSSALDYKTDSLLRKEIHENFGGRTTTIIVAQRVSSIMASDLILVLDEGVIIGRGTHAELMESCETYSKISESQMGGALLE